MGSSTAVAFRALVMLACLVAVPAVAIFWDSWPQILDSLRAGRLPKLVVVDEPNLDRQAVPRGGEAPLFQPGAGSGVVAAELPQLSEAPAWNPPPAASPRPESSAPEMTPPPWAINPTPPQSQVPADSMPASEYAGPRDWSEAEANEAVVPSAHQEPVADLRRGERRPGPTGQRMPGEIPVRRNAPTVPAHQQAGAMPATAHPSNVVSPVVAPAQHVVDPNSSTPFVGPEYTIPDAVRPAPDALAGSSNLQMHPTLTAPLGTAAPPASFQMHPSATDPNRGQLNLAVTAEDRPLAPAASDLFTAIQLRLRELGATYYLLETWGQDGSLYRFHCKVALSDNPRYNRHFEATDANPMAAMQQVLEQVESAHRGR